METIGSEIRKIRIEAVIAKAKQEILNDIREDRVPAGITSFSELHDYCDANEYGGLCEEHGDMSTEDANKVQEALDLWIKCGNAQLCVHCQTPIFWDEEAMNYRHRQPTEGCPMALEPKESKRTILIHLNIEASSTDPRNDDEIIDSVLARIETGLGGAPGSLATGSELELITDYASYSSLVVCLALAEEI